MDYSKLTEEERSKLTAQNLIDAANNKAKAGKELVEQMQQINKAFLEAINHTEAKDKAVMLEVVRDVKNLIEAAKKGDNIQDVVSKLEAIKKHYGG
jgi:transcriptional regulator of heat shock response